MGENCGKQYQKVCRYMLTMNTLITTTFLNNML